MHLEKPSDIPHDWVRIRVRKKATVSMRECNGVEKFKVSWSDCHLVSDPELDVILTSHDGSSYPCKRDIFEETYIQTSDGWKKNIVYSLAQVPPGLCVSVQTLEGRVENVKHPDYIAEGPQGEIYVNTSAHVEQNCEKI